MSILNNGTNLESLSNVNITNINNDDILSYNSAIKTWKNNALNISSASLNDLNDITITIPTSKQVFTYNDTQWVNSTYIYGMINRSTLTTIPLTLSTYSLLSFITNNSLLGKGFTLSLNKIIWSKLSTKFKAQIYLSFSTQLVLLQEYKITCMLNNNLVKVT